MKLVNLKSELSIVTANALADNNFCVYFFIWIYSTSDYETKSFHDDSKEVTKLTDSFVFAICEACFNNIC